MKPLLSKMKLEQKQLTSTKKDLIFDACLLESIIHRYKAKKEISGRIPLNLSYFQEIYKFFSKKAKTEYSFLQFLDLMRLIESILT